MHCGIKFSICERSSVCRQKSRRVDHDVVGDSDRDSDPGIADDVVGDAVRRRARRRARRYMQGC